MKHLYILPIALSLAFIYPWNDSFAAEKTVTQKDLTQLREQAEELSAELSADRKRQAKLQNELREQDLAIAKLTKTLNTLDTKIANHEAQLKAQEEKAKKLDEEIKQRQTHLAKSIRALHASGQLPDFKLLFNQEDISEWQRLSTYYGYFNKSLQSEITTLNNQLSEQEQLRDSIIANKDMLAAERAEFVEDKKDLEKQKSTRKNLLARLEKNIHSKDQKLQEINASEKELQRVLSAIQKSEFSQNFPPVNAGNFAQYQGKLAWPTVGKIQHTFGSSRGGQRHYDGIVITAPAGQPVHAVFSGRIIFADWLRGYGVLMIVDHGNKYMSLYAHNDSLFKKVGDKVRSGEQIATVGTTGGLTTPALYFEIRHDGKAVNPQKWLTAKPSR